MEMTWVTFWIIVVVFCALGGGLDKYFKYKKEMKWGKDNEE